MTVLSTQARPGLRRVLDALGKLASELEADKKSASVPQADWRASLIAGQKNVIGHYRHVLATQRMPPAERQALLDRIARLEEEIRSLERNSEETRWLKAA